MPEFPHLPLPNKISAAYKHKGFKIEKKVAETTYNNLQNRRTHGKNLKRAANQVRDEWDEQYELRIEEGLPELPNENIVPIFLQVDTNLFDPESLYSFGIEVISEEENGFIIGASGDNFKSLKEKIDKFIAHEGKFKDKAAQLWNIIQGNQWRLDYILSEELKNRWNEIEDDEALLVDISVACYIKIPKPPTPKEGESAREFERRYQRWSNKKQELDASRENLELERQDELQQFLQELGAEIRTSFVSYDDSFSCRILISGRSLKDLVINYQYLFDVTEYDQLTYIQQGTGEEALIEVNFLAPDNNDPKICVIDSGMQEGHRLITDAIDTENSKCYITDINSIADGVNNGGHGTKVAGAILFGDNIPKEGTHQHRVWLQNARILNDQCWLPEELYPPELMSEIIEDYDGTKIFNLSVNSNRPCKTVHMSEWAAYIDSLSHKNGLLFIISTGNINRTSVALNNPGIVEHLQNGRNYPNYLLTNASRISNPSQSCFSLTVGAVAHDKFEDDDRESFAEKDQPSSLTRTGLGLWRMIKPDVVEYGGDFIRNKQGNLIITTNQFGSIEVVKTTLDGGNAIGYDLGTSFAAGKVSHIATKILNEIPNASANLIRVLVAQSARLPGNLFRNPSLENVRIYGYGIPNKIRATQNSSQRITLTAESQISAKQAEIYTIKIPEEIRGAANEYDVLVEVTLAYTAKPRRTRRRTKSYLSTWVDWTCSKFEESYNQFKSRVSYYSEGDEIEDPVDDAKNMQWQIRENVQWGSVKGLRRQDSSLQKDWVILKAYQMPENFSIAVIGHQGWEKDIFDKAPYAIAVSFEVLEAEVEIYNLIRIENNIEIEQQIQLDL